MECAARQRKATLHRNRQVGDMRHDHPLTRLFGELVSNTFVYELHQRDTELISYIADLLTEFTFADRLYRIRDASGRRLEDVGEMLVESNPLLAAAGSFDREREIRKHIGDYTLFFTGLFPEYLKRPRRS